MKKKPTITKLKKKADAIFSKYIRLKYSLNGIGECYTCLRKFPIGQLQCGHFVPRQHLATRYLEMNCRSQCVACNVFKKGNYTEFAARLVGEGGSGILDLLNTLKNTTKPFKISDYEAIIELYQSKIEELNHHWTNGTKGIKGTREVKGD